MEKQLLSAALHSRASYSLIMEHIAPESKRKKQDSYTPEFRILIGKVGEYYDRDAEAQHVEQEVMNALIDVSVPNDKHKERFKNILADAYSADVSVLNINSLLLQAKRHEVGDRLAFKLVNRDDASEELAEYNKLMAAEVIDDGGDEGLLRADDLAAALTAVVNGEAGMSLYPAALGEAIGPRGLQPGSHVTVFGRPEISKSGFCITNTARWAMAGYKVLYFINEDPAINIQLRILCCITGLSEDQVLADIDNAIQLANSRGFGNIVIKSLAPGSAAEIERWVDEEQPDAIVVDQLRNLWAKADSRTNQLDQVARDVRDIGKAKGIVVLSVSQAGESAEGKAILGMNDIDSSKTGIPGACDVLIGIGATKEQEHTGYRTLTLCKNKVNGNHDSISVRFIPQLSRYTNV